MTTDNRTNEPTNEELRKALNVAREHFSAIAASGEIKVWEDTGEKRGIDHQAKVWAERGARLASEALAATRVPVQGEPNGDRVAFFERARMGANHLDNIGQTVLCEWSDGGKFTTADIRELERIASRATVPDAATELAQAKSDMKTMAEVSRATFDKLKAERDAATAAVERVTAERDAAMARIAKAWELHEPFTWSFGYGPVQSCKWCADHGVSQEVASWPCPTVAALEGAPEPEVKP